MTRSRIGGLALASLVLWFPTPAALASGSFNGLPDATRTPGVVDPAVTQANIATTICVSGYTDTVRPPSSYTTALKKQQLASGYVLGADLNTSSYEEDHLISLELGGAPRDPKNLWPEPWAAPLGAHAKDRLENKLHALVCGGSLKLADAQRMVATDWTAAYRTYIGPLATSQAVTPTAPATTGTLAIGGPTSVLIGHIASASVKVSTGTRCTLSFILPSGRTSRSLGLGLRTSPPSGVITWKWLIVPGTTKGVGSLTATCGTRSGTRNLKLIVP